MEKIIDNKDFVVYRFQSDCLEPECAIDVSFDKETVKPFIEIFFYARKEGLRNKIRWCWNMLRTGYGFEHEFILRESDLPELVKILEVTNDR